MYIHIFIYIYIYIYLLHIGEISFLEPFPKRACVAKTSKHQRPTHRGEERFPEVLNRVVRRSHLRINANSKGSEECDCLHHNPAPYIAGELAFVYRRFFCSDAPTRVG